MNPQTTTEEQDLQTRFSELPEEIMALITGGTLDTTMESLKATYELSDDQVRLLENETILTLAFFAPRSEFAANIKEVLQIDQAIAEIIALDIESEIFDPVGEYFAIVEEEIEESEGTADITATEVKKKEELRNLAQTFGQPSPERLENPEVQTLTENVEPLRTMEGDMNRIHGYGAYREEQTSTEETNTPIDEADEAKLNEKLPS